MELFNFLLISGILCFYASLRAHKTDSTLLNILHSIYSFSCLLGFLIGINMPEAREYIISWIAIPMIIDITGRYLNDSFHPLSKIFKPKKKIKRYHGTV